MRTKPICLLFLLGLSLQPAHAQGTVPTFIHSAGQGPYTLAGRDPIQGGTTTIPTVLVPIALSFDAKKAAGKPFVMDAAADVSPILGSPIFSKFAFSAGDTTQYADAMLRSTFPTADGWHTLLGKPEVKTIKITIPVGYGYVLTSKSNGSSFAVVDIEFLQRELFKQLPKQAGKLVVAVTHNTTFPAACCSKTSRFRNDVRGAAPMVHPRGDRRFAARRANRFGQNSSAC
jgi:chitinase